MTSLLSLQSTPIFLNTQKNFVHFTLSKAFSKSTTQTHRSSLNSNLRSHSNLIIDIASLVPHNFLNPNCVFPIKYSQTPILRTSVLCTSISILRTKIIVTEVLPILNMVKNFDFMYFMFTDFRFYGPNSTLQKFTFSCKFFSILRTYHIKLNKNIYKFLKLNFLHYNF